MLNNYTVLFRVMQRLFRGFSIFSRLFLFSPVFLGFLGLVLVPCLNNAALAQSGNTGQRRYEWVPGSRQARWVDSTQGTNGTSINSTSTQLQGRQSQYLQQYPNQGQVQNHTKYLNQTQYQSQLQRADAGRLPASQQAQGAGRSTLVSNRDFVDSVLVAGQRREFLVHLPAGYDGKQAYPVVMAFHGLGMNGHMMFGLTGFTGLSDRKGFIVVFPTAVGGRWQDGLTATGNDDVAFVQSMLDRLAVQFKIDRRRVYACGISNGGYFTQLLALTIPERIAACGVVASTLTRGGASRDSTHSRMPIVFFLGSEDPLIPWDDGRSKKMGKLGEALGVGGDIALDGAIARLGGLSTAPDTIDFWVSRNAASPTPRSTRLPDRSANDGTHVEKTVWGSGSSQVMLYKIEGGGHTWPGCLNLKAISDVSGAISQDIDASEEMWEFFRNFSR